MGLALRAGLMGAAGLGLAACHSTLTSGGTSAGLVDSWTNPGLGDGAPGLNAEFVQPLSIDIDGAGNLYVADSQQNRIRKIADHGNGLASTIAGTGEQSVLFLLGKPGPVTPVNQPGSVTVTPTGNVYWTSLLDCRIYGMDGNGNVEAYAGSGCGGPGSDPAPSLQFQLSLDGCSEIHSDPLGNLVVADRYNQRIVYVNLSPAPVTPVGLATVAAGETRTIAGGGTPPGLTLNFPCNARLAGGSLFIADTNNARIVSASNGTFGVRASLGPLGFNPAGIAVDTAQQAFYFPVDGGLYQFAWGQSAVSFGTVQTAPQGNGLLGGQPNKGLPFTVDTGSALAQSFGWNGPGPSPLLDGGDLIVADPPNGVLRRIDHLSGAAHTVAGFGAQGSIDLYPNRPLGLALAPDGSLYLTAGNARLWRVGPDRELQVVAGTNGNPDATITAPVAALSDGFWGEGLTVDPADGSIYLTDDRRKVIRRIRPDGIAQTVAGNGNGGSDGDGGPPGGASFRNPSAVVLDGQGGLYILDLDRIRFVNGGSSPRTVMQTVVQPGTIMSVVGSTGAGFSPGYGGDGGPAHLARIDLQSNQGPPIASAALDAAFLYFADTNNNRIRRVDLGSGVIDTVVGNGNNSGDASTVGQPVGVALSGGFLYWSQQSGPAVRRIDLTGGAPETVLGDYSPGFYGDGGPGSAAEMTTPGQIAIDPAGNLFVAERGHRIRRVKLGP